MNTNPDSLRHQWEVLKSLPFKKKLEHIWHYYHYGIFVALCVLVLIVWGIQAGVNANKEVLISGMLINTDTTNEGAAFLEDGYWRYCGSDSHQRVDLVRGRQIHLDDERRTQADDANFLMLSVMVSSRGLDYVIIDEESIPMLETEGILMDLKTLLPEDRLSGLDTVESASGTIAIRLSGTEFAKKYPFTVDDACLMVISNTPSPERAAQFVNYLLDA